MPRYVALLRGVSPMNLKMPALKASLETAGFDNVKTLLSSGNVAFDATRRDELALAKRIESALEDSVGKRFWTVVRSSRYLQVLVEHDPFAGHRLPVGAKKVVTFLREPHEVALVIPPERDGARILEVRGQEILSCYVPQPGNPAFMTLLEKTYGKAITTRTWDTVKKCAAA